MKRTLVILAVVGTLGACSAANNESVDTQDKQVADIETSVQSQPAAIPKDHSKIVRGNGEHNFIILEGATRDGNVFTFPEVEISQVGFLVMHPFRDGKPVPTEYVGAVAVPEGRSQNVEIPVTSSVETGDMFIVMLHYDMNADGIFDFNDGITVPDAPVFEGHTLVALTYAAP